MFDTANINQYSRPLLYRYSQEGLRKVCLAFWLTVFSLNVGHTASCLLFTEFALKNMGHMIPVSTQLDCSGP